MAKTAGEGGGKTPIKSIPFDRAPKTKTVVRPGKVAITKSAPKTKGGITTQKVTMSLPPKTISKKK